MHIKTRINLTLKSKTNPLYILIPLLLMLYILPDPCFGRIYIDINSPSIRKFNIAIPDFKNLTRNNKQPELSEKLPAVISNDLDLSGYFNPIDKEAFLEDAAASELDTIRFKDWSVIGAELLVKGNYICIGRSVEVEIKLFDVFWGRQILGKRVLGDIERYDALMHRLGNEIIRVLTGQPGIFLTKLAFVGNSSGHKEIQVCDYDGRNVRNLTKDKSIALLPKWSPSGKKLLYTSFKDGGSKLYLRDIESGSDRKVSARSGLNIGASWTPNEKNVALTLSLKGNPDIFTIDLKGKIQKQLTNHWGIDVSPAFSPDGKKLAFVSNRSGTPHIYTRDLERGTEQRLTFEGTYNQSPSWSSQNRIAFVSNSDGRFDICTMNADGSGLRYLTENHGNNEDPCWSPDGRYIVFSSNRDGRYHLFIMNANGRNQRRITFQKGDQTAPTWAP